MANSRTPLEVLYRGYTGFLYLPEQTFHSFRESTYTCLVVFCLEENDIQMFTMIS